MKHHSSEQIDRKSERLAAHAERQREADAVIAHKTLQRIWSAGRSTKEAARPLAGRLFAPAIPKVRFLQKKFQRPTPVTVHYREGRPENPLILHLLANFEIGGTPRLVCDIMEGTQDRFRHLVISKHVERPAPYAGIEILDMPLPLEDRQLAKLIHKERPAAVHIHYWNGMKQDFVWYHSIFKVLEEFNIPVVENVNTSGEPYFSESVDRYIFCSEWSRRASGASWISEEVIYPGTRLEDFYRSDLEGVTDDHVGMVYRLDGDKIGPNAIEILIQVMKARPTARATIVGDGLLVNPFRARVHEEGLEDRIIFTGWVSYDRLRQLYREFSVYIAPVKDDTFGSVSVYAMCAGLPVVGFDVGGIPEIVGSPGLLAPPGDVGRFAEIVTRLLGDRQRRLEIGAENQMRARTLFDVAAMTGAFANVYDELIAARSAG
ncbi:MAG: glycosyltransferase family 4 protein [Proteobacteria bacterium]|nr:glycosyltransferase family 4 protein [Pseudomonadota bacterium]